MSESLSNFNYVVGRGRVFFAPFLAGTMTPGPEGYFGNTPSLELTQATTDLKHYSSEAGLKVQDGAVTLERNITAQFACDNISPSNLALWWGATSNPVNQAATVSAATQQFTVQPGYWYQIGSTANSPLGLSNLASVTYAGVEEVDATGTVTFTAQPAVNDTVTIGGNVITFVATAPGAAQVELGGNYAGTAQEFLQYVNVNSAQLGVSASGAGAVITLNSNVYGTAGNAITLAKSSAGITVSGATLTGGTSGTSQALVEGVDVQTDLQGGRFQVLTTGGVQPNSVITATYELAAAATDIVITNEIDIYGALRFVADNPVGTNTDYYFPYVKLQSSGNFSLKGDAWQTMTFQGEVLKIPGSTLQRVYSRQRPGTGEGN
jgi:hypothetical protein